MKDDPKEKNILRKSFRKKIVWNKFFWFTDLSLSIDLIFV